MPNKTDYSQEIKDLIKGNYDPVESTLHENEQTLKMSLSEITREIKSVLPKDWIYEEDVYQILVDLGFKSFIINYPELTDKNGDVVRSAYSNMEYLLQPK